MHTSAQPKRALHLAAAPAARIHPRLQACLPARVHPVSQRLLEAWVSGQLPTPLFQRFFHMPDSDYLPVGECLVQVMAELRQEAEGRHQGI